MNVLWIVPQIFSFISDELEEMSNRVSHLTVLTSNSVTDSIKQKLTNVEFIHCKPRSFIFEVIVNKKLHKLLTTRNMFYVLKNDHHLREIAGIYHQLVKFYKISPPDIIHSHFAHPGGIGASLIPGVTQVLTLRGYDILTTGSYGALWNPFYRNNLIKFNSRNVIITTASRYSTNVARQILGTDADIRRIPGGITEESFVSSGKLNRKSLNIPENAIVLIAVGHLIPRKNYDMLIKSLPVVIQESKEPVFLLICGKGLLEDKLMEVVKQLKLEGCIRFLGNLPRDELTDAYKMSDILVHPALTEGFGNVVLEGILHELLIVASPVGIAPDIIQHEKNGFLAELGEQNSLEKSLIQAIRTLPVKNEIVKDNKKIILSQYTMRSRIDSYVEIYKQLKP